MFPIRITYENKTVNLELNLDESYETNITNILPSFDLLLQNENENENEDETQLAFKYSIQHQTKQKKERNYYLEASMFVQDSKFWQDVANSGDEFILRNEYQRVESKLKLLRNALKEANEAADGKKQKQQEGETKTKHQTNSSVASIASIASIDTITGPGKVIKTCVFGLRDCLECFQFAEEFIADGGIKTLLTVTRQTSGNTQAYALKALSLALDFANGLDVIINTSGSVNELFKLLNPNSKLTVQREVLSLLFVITDTGPKTGYKQVNKAAKEWARHARTLPYQIIVTLIQSPDPQTRINALALLNVLLQVQKHKIKRAKLCERLMQVNVIDSIALVLEKEGDNDKDFERQASFFQEFTGVVIEGSDYEVEVYRKRLEDMTELYESLNDRLVHFGKSTFGIACKLLVNYRFLLYFFVFFLIYIF